MRRMADASVVAHIAFDGPILADGAMDVRDLAPSLLALGELLQGANRVLNGDKATLAVKVQADFKTGSFDVGLALFQGVAAQLMSLIHSDTVKNASDIAKFVGLITGTNLSLFGLLKWLKGRKPDDTTTTTLQNGNIEITITGDNNSVVVSPEVYQIASDPACRDAIHKVVKPVATEGITAFEVRRGKQVIESVTKDDLPSFEVPEISRSLPEQPPVTQVVEIVKPSFDEDLTWTLSDGGAGGRFDAVVTDQAFIERVKNGEDFRIGDLLRVKIETHQWLTDKGLRTRREVVEVIEEMKAPRQTPLLPTPQFKQPPLLDGKPAESRKRKRRGRRRK